MGVNHLSETQQQRAAAAAAMSINKVNTPYPLIDADPHFNRVVRYMRPSDYAAMGVFTLGAPAAIYGYQMADPAPLRRLPLRVPEQLEALLGLDRERARAKDGPRGTVGARQSWLAALWRDRLARVHPGRCAPQLALEPTQVLCDPLVQRREPPASRCRYEALLRVQGRVISRCNVCAFTARK